MNPSSLGATWEISSLSVPLLRSLAEWEIHFAIDISLLTALAMRRLAGLAFSTELDDVKDDFTERLRYGANDDPSGAGSESWGAAPGSPRRIRFASGRIRPVCGPRADE